jgi:hypothetical protein
MASEDASGFRIAMDNEIDELAKKHAWNVVPAITAEQADKRVFGTTQMGL